MCNVNNPMLGFLAVEFLKTLREVSEATRESDRESIPHPPHPTDVAIKALELYRAGVWDKRKAMAVIAMALEDFRAGNYQPIDLRTRSLPCRDRDYLEQLFR